MSKLSFAASWTLRRWLFTCFGVMGAVLLALVAMLALNYAAAADSRDSARRAAAALTQLQTHLRGLNEAVLSDGSTSALKLARDSGRQFVAELVALGGKHGGDELGTLLKSRVQPAWQRADEAAKAMLAIKGLSASDDKSMIAYGRVAGLTEEVVAGTAAIEAGAMQSAVAAERRLVVLGVAGAVVSLLVLMMFGVVISRVVFARLGGEPALARALATRLAAYDLAVEFPAARADEGATVMAALRQIRDSLAEVVSQVRLNSESVAAASIQIATGNQELSGRTGQQSGMLQKAAAAMEQLGATVRHNADSAAQANELARGASSVAVKGGDVVGQVVATMSGIDESARRIADIIGVIDGIAFQTNILALNAAVEAARAGEQGRGFAVVAAEVRSLAQRSAAAAREIKGLIDTSVERVAQGNALVGQAGSTMAEVVASIQRVTGIMAEISDASREQSLGVTQVGEAVSQMDQATQQNADLVQQSAVAAQGLREQAQQLVGAVAVFRLGDVLRPAGLSSR